MLSSLLIMENSALVELDFYFLKLYYLKLNFLLYLTI